MIRRYRYSAKMKTIQYIVFGGFIVTIAFLSVQNYSLKQELQTITNEQTDTNLKPNNEQHVKILVANKTLPTGSILKESDFSFVEIESSKVSTQVTDVQLAIDKQINTTLNPGQELHLSMLRDTPVESTDKTRYVEHTFLDGAVPVTLSPEQINNSIVDIMLFREGAPDQVVVAKTPIIHSSGNKVGFHLTYQEMVKLKEAATEGYLYLAFYLSSDQETSLKERSEYILPYDLPYDLPKEE